MEEPEKNIETGAADGRLSDPKSPPPESAATPVAIGRVVDEGKPAPDVGSFIDEIKNDQRLPEEIGRALEQARQRIHVDIPEPPADLWDPELDELSQVTGPEGVRRSMPRAITPASEAELDLFAAQSGEEPELFEPKLAADSAGEAAAKTSEQTAEPAHETDAAPSSEESAKEQAASGAAKTAPSPPHSGKTKAKKSGGSAAADAQKKPGFNPWNLIFGRGHLVDATATLIFMHAGLLFGLELLWKQLPLLLPHFNKNSFESFVLATAAIQGLTLLFPMFLCFNLYKIPSGTLLGKVKIERALVLSSLLMGLPAALFFNGINNIFTYLMINWDVVLPAYVLPTWASASSKQGLLLMVLVAALLPSILEELFFRGFLQKALYGLKRKRSAIILSALAFAFFHNDPLFVVGPFGAGILLGYLRKNSESVIPAILTHFSMNCASFFLDPILPRFNTQMVLLFPEEGLSTLLANIVATVASGIVLFFIYRFINANLIRTRAYAGFMTGRRAAIYGRNQTQRARLLDSPDRLYKAPALNWGNYLRLVIAVLVWLLSRFLIH